MSGHLFFAQDAVAEIEAIKKRVTNQQAKMKSLVSRRCLCSTVVPRHATQQEKRACLPVEHVGFVPHTTAVRVKIGRSAITAEC